MKALVLCGGIPQIELMKNLKARGIEVILADMNEKVVGRPFADRFYPVSVMDEAAVQALAEEEKVDFLISVCADQVLQVAARISERLGLPCYIDAETAEKVSQKTLMKKIFWENGVPTSKYLITDAVETSEVAGMRYPLVVKPADAYSSRGVKKVMNIEALPEALAAARNISRTHTAIVEEYVSGTELTVDAYVEDGTAHVLCISQSDKVPFEDRFVICRTVYPTSATQQVKEKIRSAAQGITDAFGLKNTPMLIQLIHDGENVSVLEFCARTGGCIKFRHIQRVSGFDVIDAIVELTLGNRPHIGKLEASEKYVTNEFLYCDPCVFDHLEGFEELLQDGVITEYYPLKAAGTELTGIRSSGDRVACMILEADTKQQLIEKRREANRRIKAVDIRGKDMLRHDIMDTYAGE